MAVSFINNKQQVLPPRKLLSVLPGNVRTPWHAAEAFCMLKALRHRIKKGIPALASGRYQPFSESKCPPGSVVNVFSDVNSFS
jgi:hypothetical protein